MTFDLFTLGEAMLRLSVPTGSRLEDAPTLRVGVGGAEANVAVAVARMGHTAGFFTLLPQSPLGRKAAREISSHGVDLSSVRWVEGGRMGTYYVELASPPGTTQVWYDRLGSTAAAMEVNDVSWDVLSTARVVHLTGITPALSSSCREVALQAAHRARSAGAIVTVDINFRRGLWAPDEARSVLLDLCASANTVILTEGDLTQLFGIHPDSTSMLQQAQEMFETATVIVTRGDRGSAWRVGAHEGATPAYPAVVVDRVGSGDAFAAGVIVGLLQGDPVAGISLGTAMAALKRGWEGDQFWGNKESVLRLLESAGREVIR